jgi:mannose-1-phosphate guanylyltransferase
MKKKRGKSGSGGGRGEHAAAIDARAVILAGGRGTRFWPLGRAARPKQFLPITGRRSMVEETVRRIRPVISGERVLMVADGAQTRGLRKIFPEAPAANFLVEPLARNTAPSLMLATAVIWLENPEAVIAVLPADHLIRDRKTFLGKLRAALAFAAAEPALVTFGIRPSSPATGYGYIRFSKDRPRRQDGESFYPVRAFREKPGLAQARRFLASGDYAWNSGMFVWRAGVFARELEARAPELFPFWKQMIAALKARDRGKLRRAFERVPAVSIDYALMEKAGSVFVCEGDFGWSDVGAWSSLFGIWPGDGAGNVVRGESLVLDSRGCLVHNPGRLTALIGVRDLIVVEAGDALLICAADRDQRVKEAVEALRAKGKTRYL